MDVREKLVELLDNAIIDSDDNYGFPNTNQVADHLIAHGVTVQEWISVKETTNADRIRAMSNEELAEWLVKKTVYQESAWSEPSYLNFLTESDDTRESAIKGTAKWLKQPAEEV